MSIGTKHRHPMVNVTIITAIINNRHNRQQAQQWWFPLFPISVIFANATTASKLTNGGFPSFPISPFSMSGGFPSSPFLSSCHPQVPPSTSHLASVLSIPACSFPILPCYPIRFPLYLFVRKFHLSLQYLLARTIQLPTTNYLLSSSYFLLPTTYYLLPTVYCLLPTFPLFYFPIFLLLRFHFPCFPFPEFPNSLTLIV